jgi:rare lipoprotein A
MAAGARRRHRVVGAMAAAVLTLLAACGSAPRSGAGGPFDAGRDGPPSHPPADLAERPDAEPRVEPIRSGGPNKPYEVAGRRYTPLAADEPVAETGLASWYGRRFHGRPTASGEVYDMYAMSAAHRTMPLPSYARVRNPANGREVVVRVNDRGPFESGRIIDLSYAAASKLGVLRGVAPVQVQRLTHEDIRSGRWRGETAVVLAAAAPAPPEPPAAPAASVAPTPPATPAAPAASPEPALLSAARDPMAAAATGTDPPQAAAPAAPAAPESTPALETDAPHAARPKAGGSAKAAPGFWVQLGAFRQVHGAFELRRQLVRELAWLEPWLTIFEDGAMFRVQVGPYASRTEAQGTAERIRGSAAAPPMVVQRR